ncbi:Cyclic nucleotide-binding protein [Pseudocohnilembus persalinus]|uniref:Cyclic nucleotide-binding protein n=1 Tax=Pseudocohnilembus persalinus TaxID=266149 RepID=A0A0V0QEV1_PSEPJ|nr:Cyclic nucleotide-binding protein [Pseudocohnilembus persalinus]|eukprot:KRX00745.1 Cyclic nucleotide-binding protein [Pseudocohnilembus persalinus]
MNENSELNYTNDKNQFKTNLENRQKQKNLFNYQDHKDLQSKMQMFHLQDQSVILEQLDESQKNILEGQNTDFFQDSLFTKQQNFNENEVQQNDDIIENDNIGLIQINDSQNIINTTQMRQQLNQINENQQQCRGSKNIEELQGKSQEDDHINNSVQQDSKQSQQNSKQLIQEINQSEDPSSISNEQNDEQNFDDKQQQQNDTKTQRKLKQKARINYIQSLNSRSAINNSSCQHNSEMNKTSVYWSVGCMVSVLLYLPQTNIEIVFATFANLFTTGVFGYALNTIGMILQEVNKKKKQYNSQRQRVNRFFVQRKIPQQLRQRITLYLDFVYEQSKNNNHEEEEQILKTVSKQLKKDKSKKWSKGCELCGDINHFFGICPQIHLIIDIKQMVYDYVNMDTQLRSAYIRNSPKTQNAISLYEIIQEIVEDIFDEQISEQELVDKANQWADFYEIQARQFEAQNYNQTMEELNKKKAKYEQNILQQITYQNINLIFNTILGKNQNKI